MVCNYNDKEMITDVLSTQKHLTDGYNNYANESACESVRNTMMSVLGEEHDIAHEVFCLMNRTQLIPYTLRTNPMKHVVNPKFHSNNNCFFFYCMYMLFFRRWDM